jgi:hypothetical protein
MVRFRNGAQQLDQVIRKTYASVGHHGWGLTVAGGRPTVGSASQRVPREMLSSVRVTWQIKPSTRNPPFWALRREMRVMCFPLMTGSSVSTTVREVGAKSKQLGSAAYLATAVHGSSRRSPTGGARGRRGRYARADVALVRHSRDSGDCRGPRGQLRLDNGSAARLRLPGTGRSRETPAFPPL